MRSSSTPACARRFGHVACAALIACACTNFDREDRIEDMRVLAIKTEPAEILYSPLHLLPPASRPPVLPLPDINVRVEIFAYDPRAGRTSSSVQLCPAGAGDSTCRLYEREADLALEPAAHRDELRALLLPHELERAPLEAPAARVAPSVIDWTFSPAVIDFFIPDRDGNPVPSLFPLLPRIVAQAENLDASAPAVVKERAFKRIPVALDLTSPDLPPDLATDLAAGLGVTLCTAPIPDSVWDEQGRATCLEARSANTNPRLQGFHLDETPEALASNVGTLTDVVVSVDLRERSIVEAIAGDVLHLTPVFGLSGPAINSVERYQVVSFDVEASKIIILNRIEDFAVSWYSTRGELSRTLTAEQFTQGLGATWTLPIEAGAGEQDTLVVVVLDQRGGTAVGEIVVTYQ
jgi:hypothetical protein